MSDSKAIAELQRKVASLQRKLTKETLLLDAANREIKVTEHWAQVAFAEQRRLSDRIVLVYGNARAAGLTHEQLTAADSAPRLTDSERQS